jgi:mono/diheme cytochrome c family protein
MGDHFLPRICYRTLGLILLMFWTCAELPAQAQTNSDWADRERTVSPRRVAESRRRIRQVATVRIRWGVTKRVPARSTHPTAPGVGDRFCLERDSGTFAGAAAVDSQTSSLLKLRLTEPGAYTISLTPMDEANQPQAAATVSLWAARYAGAAGGTLKCTTCHAPEANLWKTTRHATFLQNLLNGAYQTTYDTNCLACHAVGAFADTRGDNNFLDAAETVSFDLTQIKTWVEDAVATGNQNYTKLPLELQTLAGFSARRATARVPRTGATRRESRRAIWRGGSARFATPARARMAGLPNGKIRATFGRIPRRVGRSPRMPLVWRATRRRVLSNWSCAVKERLTQSTRTATR